MSTNNSNPLKPNNSTSIKKKLTKSTHVPTACLNCKKAHLACDLSRPCKRCVSLDKSSTCIDIKHKKRGRPKLSEKRWFSGVSESSGLSSSPLIEINSVSAGQSPPALANLINTSNHHYSHSLSSSSPSPPSFTHILPLTVPLVPTSSFEITQSIDDRTSDFYPTKILTLFLSMDLCCARVSDESVDLLGRRPDNIGHCSFYDLIQSGSMNTLSRIHRLLLDNCHSGIQQKHPISFSTTANSDQFQKMSPLQLFSIANGSQTFKESLSFKKEKGEYVTLDCKFYLGGAFGADLSKFASLENLYIVCIASEPFVSSLPSSATNKKTQETISLLSEFPTPSTTTDSSPILTTISTSSTAISSTSAVTVSSPIQSNLSTTTTNTTINTNPDIMSFVSSSAVDSLLAHDQLETNLYPVTSSPDFLTTYNSPNGLHEKDAMDLVNHLYCSVIAPSASSDASESKNISSFKQCLYSSPISDTYSDDSMIDASTIINENSLIMLSKTPPRVRLGSSPLW